MSTRLSLRIQERLSRLTKSEQKLGKLIIDQPMVIETHSATELAKIVGVSKATAARFFRSLGYLDFNEVKAQAREERNRTAPYQYSVSLSEAKSLGRTIGDHLNLEIQNLTRTFEEMNSEEASRAAELIAEAPKVWFLGFGLDDALARFGRIMFARLRHNVFLLGSSGHALVEDLAMAGPRDVLIAITLEPHKKILKSIYGYVNTTHMNVISITAHEHLVQAKRYSDVVLPCHVSSYGLLPSHTSLYSTLRLLALSYIGHVGEAAIQRTQMMHDIHDELEDFGF